jgi:hypothetical protein
MKIWENISQRQPESSSKSSVVHLSAQSKRKMASSSFWYPWLILKLTCLEIGFVGSTMAQV